MHTMKVMELYYSTILAYYLDVVRLELPLILVVRKINNFEYGAMLIQYASIFFSQKYEWQPFFEY